MFQFKETKKFKSWFLNLVPALGVGLKGDGFCVSDAGAVGWRLEASFLSILSLRSWLWVTFLKNNLPLIVKYKRWTIKYNQTKLSMALAENKTFFVRHLNNYCRGILYSLCLISNTCAQAIKNLKKASKKLFDLARVIEKFNFDVGLNNIVRFIKHSELHKIGAH